MQRDKDRADNLQVRANLLGILAALVTIVGTAYTVYVAAKAPLQQSSVESSSGGTSRSDPLPPGTAPSSVPPAATAFTSPTPASTGGAVSPSPPAGTSAPPEAEPIQPPERTRPPDPAPRVEPDAELASLARLLNPSPAEHRRVAVAVRSRTTGTGGRPADRLVSAIEAAGIPLSRGFFRPAFLNSGHFQQLMAGDGVLLARSGALGSGSLALIAELDHSFRPGDYRLTVCDLHLSYTVLDSDGATRAQRSVSVSVPAYDRTTALNDAVSALLEEHAATIVSDLQR